MNSEFLPHELRTQLAQRPRLLVVDDQPINIRAIHALFGRDCEVQMATDGATAIRLCETAPPDLVLLDVRMPDLDGYEVCRRLRDAGINQVVPVLFLTSALDQDDELRGFEAGAVDFIRKPIQPVVVRARVATHLSLKLQRDLIRRQALTDALTGLPNRRQFEQELARQWQQALRHDRTLALLVIDIDYFKQYNDHYGHVAGDACLQQVAQAMQAAIRRPYDLLARYGGEEFVVLLAETGLDGAMQVAQALLTAVAAQAMPHTASLVRPYVSISIGVAAARATPQQSAHDLLHRADQQLYAAKAGGRARASAGEVAA